MPEEPFDLWLPPAQATSAAIFNSPHSGSDYHGSFLGRTRLAPLLLRSSEDAFVDRLIAPATRHGAALPLRRAQRRHALPAGRARPRAGLPVGPRRGRPR